MCFVTYANILSVSQFEIAVSLDIDSLTNDSQPIESDIILSNTMPDTNYTAGQIAQISLNISEYCYYYSQTISFAANCCIKIKEKRSKRDYI